MATVTREIYVRLSPQDVWDAVRDVGALHTRLVPGFVLATELEKGARIVTFANGMKVREPIVSSNDAIRRLVWTAEGGRTTHFNGALQVFDDPNGARLLWTSDFLPDEATEAIEAAMSAGAAAMSKAFSKDAAPGG